jgi:hypothetical protein
MNKLPNEGAKILTWCCSTVQLQAEAASAGNNVVVVPGEALNAARGPFLHRDVVVHDAVGVSA